MPASACERRAAKQNFTGLLEPEYRTVMNACSFLVGPLSVNDDRREHRGRIVGGAQDDAFDTAILVSGDSDLTRPVQAVQTRYPTKRVVVAFPPNRTSSQLRDAASAGFVIGRKKLLDSQLPDRVIKRDGHVLTRPQEWR